MLAEENDRLMERMATVTTYITRNGLIQSLLLELRLFSNRYTTDRKSLLHGWRGAWAPFRSAQLLVANNIFKIFTF